ncbi:MAG TPA: VanZ family protein [Silvibacterium sp.]|nr:VanZ family protein [Silvibacterium sp.]
MLHWAPAALAVAMIMGESTATMSADNTSHWLLPFWVHFFGSISNARWAEVHHLIRKTGHMVGYGMVSVCFFYGWRSSLSTAVDKARSVWRRAGVLAVLSTLVVASADEIHQSFLPSRTGTPVDVGIDLCGAIAAQLLILAIVSLTARKQEPVAIPA